MTKLKCYTGDRLQLEKDMVKSLFTDRFDNDALKRLHSKGQLILCKTAPTPAGKTRSSQSGRKRDTRRKE